MPQSRYVNISIDDQQLDLQSAQNLPIAISYKLEDRENFQQKSSSRALSVIVPANPTNDKIFNTFRNSGIEDFTIDETFKKNRRGVIESNGQELLVGKAFLKEAAHDYKPLDYEVNFYGDNADWLIDLKEATLYDFLKHISFQFTKINIENSWQYDGTNRNLPYVFAPVRYGEPLATYEVVVDNVVQSRIEDYNMQPEYMKPSLSKYWIVFEAFKSLGYTVQSDFFDSEYFRRQVMPWTWGNFLLSDGTRLDNLDFLAKSTKEVFVHNIDWTGILNMEATNDSINGAFDNNFVYDYDTLTNEMKWTYQPAFNYGLLSATFHLNMYVRGVATAGGEVEVRVQWFINGQRFTNNPLTDNGNGDLIIDLDAPAPGRRDFTGNVDIWATINVNPGDVISAKIYVHTNKTSLGIARINLFVDAFELDYFRIPLGGTIDFENYTGFKKYKFLDFLSGVVDEFNLAFNTDAVNKVVYIEPEHPYSLQHDQSEKSGGYFNGKTLDWSAKQDLEKRSNFFLFSDYERELHFKYQDDENDGTTNIISNRNVNTPAMAKYVFPDRFKAGKKEIENRFFSAVMHADMVQWGDLGTVYRGYPQIICLVPENISNTSRNEAQNTFKPKSAYYKGLTTDYGWMFDGVVKTNYPNMFAVNYKAGGENDPILSYCDEVIGTDLAPVTGIGLLRRFYLQKLEIMRNGQYYKTYFKLNNNDVGNFLHREHIICAGQRWELVEINNYSPLKEESTEVFLRKWNPIRHA